MYGVGEQGMKGKGEGSVKTGCEEVRRDEEYLDLLNALGWRAKDEGKGGSWSMQEGLEWAANLCSILSAHHASPSQSTSFAAAPSV